VQDPGLGRRPSRDLGAHGSVETVSLEKSEPATWYRNVRDTSQRCPSQADSGSRTQGWAWASRSSQSPGLQTRFDGSVDIFFGPTAPESGESNWVPTKAGGRFEALFRFYGPTPPLFDKTWTLPDIERIG